MTCTGINSRIYSSSVVSPKCGFVFILKSAFNMIFVIFAIASAAGFEKFILRNAGIHSCSGVDTAFTYLPSNFEKAAATSIAE